MRVQSKYYAASSNKTMQTTTGRQAESPAYVPAVAHLYCAANRWENNPVQIEAAERMSRRGR
jgi:hypothetical protein